MNGWIDGWRERERGRERSLYTHYYSTICNLYIYMKYKLRPPPSGPHFIFYALSKLIHESHSTGEQELTSQRLPSRFQCKMAPFPAEPLGGRAQVFRLPALSAAEDSAQPMATGEKPGRQLDGAGPREPCMDVSLGTGCPFPRDSKRPPPPAVCAHGCSPPVETSPDNWSCSQASHSTSPPLHYI